MHHGDWCFHSVACADCIVPDDEHVDDPAADGASLGCECPICDFLRFLADGKPPVPECWKYLARSAARRSRAKP